MRKATWAIFIWTGLAGFMIWGIVNAAERMATEGTHSAAVNVVATGTSIVLVLGIWWSASSYWF